MFYTFYSDLNSTEDNQVSLNKDSPTPTGKVVFNLVNDSVLVSNYH